MRVTVTFFSFMLSASMALAGPVDDAIVQQLQNHGYTAIDVRKTLLGRVRIIAANKNRVREIILNPNSGEILRDYSSRRTRLLEPLLRGIENNQGTAGYGGNTRPEDRGQAEDSSGRRASTNSNSSGSSKPDAPPASKETQATQNVAKGTAASAATAATRDPVSDAASGADAPSD